MTNVHPAHQAPDTALSWHIPCFLMESLCKPPIPLWNKHGPSSPTHVHAGMCYSREVQDVPLELMVTSSLKMLLLLSPRGRKSL